MSAHIEPILTVADLDLMPDDGNRYELIEGDIVVSRSPSLSHQMLLKNLVRILDNHLDVNPVGSIWPTPGVIFDDFNAVIPDLVFVRNDRLDEIASGDKVIGAPDLAVEILSPGAENSRRDRFVKLQTYGKFGVVEYWIVDGSERAIDVYRAQSGKLVLTATVRDQDELTSPLLPGFSCQVERVFKGRRGRMA
jgi:Uma2 family endonuclease